MPKPFENLPKDDDPNLKQWYIEIMREEWPYMDLEGRRWMAEHYPTTYGLSGLSMDDPMLPTPQEYLWEEEDEEEFLRNEGRYSPDH